MSGEVAAAAAGGGTAGSDGHFKISAYVNLPSRARVLILSLLSDDKAGGCWTIGLILGLSVWAGDKGSRWEEVVSGLTPHVGLSDQSRCSEVGTVPGSLPSRKSSNFSVSLRELLADKVEDIDTPRSLLIFLGVISRSCLFGCPGYLNISPSSLA